MKGLKYRSHAVERESWVHLADRGEWVKFKDHIETVWRSVVWERRGYERVIFYLLQLLP